ncbi:MAG TPA: hypothetical protein VIY47_05880, partial [Ignavibacteriaceae bacterium]
LPNRLLNERFTQCRFVVAIACQRFVSKTSGKMRTKKTVILSGVEERQFFFENGQTKAMSHFDSAQCDIAFV